MNLNDGIILTLKRIVEHLVGNSVCFCFCVLISSSSFFSLRDKDRGLRPLGGEGDGGGQGRQARDVKGGSVWSGGDLVNAF